MTNKSSTLLLVSSSVRVSLDRLKKDCDHIQVQLIHFRSVCGSPTKFACLGQDSPVFSWYIPAAEYQRITGERAGPELCLQGTGGEREGGRERGKEGGREGRREGGRIVSITADHVFPTVPTVEPKDGYPYSKKTLYQVRDSCHAPLQSKQHQLLNLLVEPNKWNWCHLAGWMGGPDTFPSSIPQQLQ